MAVLTTVNNVNENGTATDDVASGSTTITRIRYTDRAGAVVDTTIAVGPAGSTFLTFYGTLTINQNGSYSYVANAPAAEALDTGDLVQEVFSYDFGLGPSIGAGDVTDDGTTTISITGVNDAPVIVNNTYFINEDSGPFFQAGPAYLGNDTDVDDAVLTAPVLLVGPTNGTWSGLIDGTFTYTPNANFFGTDTVTVQVTDGEATVTEIITFVVANVNDAYVAVDDFSDPGGPGGDPGVDFFPLYDFNEDATQSGTIAQLLANDINPDGDLIDVQSITNLFDVNNPGVQVGTISYNAGAGTFVITPNANWSGDAFFDYVARNTDTGEIDTGRVFVEVDSVSDAPEGADVTRTTAEDTPRVFLLSDFALTDVNDTPADTISGVRITTLPADGQIQYDTDPGAGVTWVAVAAGTLVSAADITAGRLRFVPDLNENDNTAAPANYTTFTFQVNDTGSTTDGGVVQDTTPNTFTFSVTPVNDNPVAVNDTYSTIEDVTLTVAAPGVLANDVDDGDPELTQTLVVTSTGTFATAGGSVTINADGSFVYDPDDNYQGVDTFNYTISDGAGGTASATVTINVGNIADIPTAVDDAEGPVNEDVPGQAAGLLPGGFAFRTEANGFFLESDLLADDFDDDNIPPSNAGLDITGVGAPVGGTVALYTSPGGTQYVVFTPFANYSGPGGFDYAVTDPEGNSDIGRVTFDVLEVADGGPVATDDSITGVTEQVSRTFNEAEIRSLILGNDTDPDNAGAGAGTDQLQLRAILNIQNATIDQIVTDANGNITSFRLTTNSNQNGLNASFDYVVDDSAARAASTADPRVQGAPDTRTGTDIGTVTITVTAVNDAPIALDDTTATILEDSAGISFTQAFLLSNDSDPDNAGGSNAGLTIVNVGGLVPGSGNSVTDSQGTLTANADGTYTFVPAANFNGTAAYNYTVTDASGATDTEQVFIPVTAVNDEPVANDDGTLPVGLLQPANFFGSLGPNDGNDPISPGAPLVVEDRPATFTWEQLLANDNDGDPTGSVDDDQTLTILPGTSNFGTVTVDSVARTITFTPTAGYTGPASFTYILQDDGGTANGGDNQDTGTVFVNVVNDEPLSAIADNYSGGAQQSVQVRGLGGNDTIEGTAAIDQLFGGADNDTLRGLGGNDYLYGGSGNNSLDGGDGNDSFYINDGGNDTVVGGNGNDAVFAGNNLNAADNINLGSGINTLAIQGGAYAGGYAFGANNLQNVQNLVVASGQVAGIWPNPVGPGPFDYNLILQDANIAAGQILTIIGNGLGANIPGLQAGEDLTIDATDEKNGAIRVFAGQGNDNVLGGEGNDGVFFETGAWSNGGHSFDGRNGVDSVAFRGSGLGNIILNGIVRVENVVLLSEDQTNFGGQDLNLGNFDYGVTTVDSNTSAGSTLRIDGFFLNSSETLTVNAQAESNANLIIFGGNGNDTISGGNQSNPVNGAGGVDLIYGGGGGDSMNGGAAAEVVFIVTLASRAWDGVNVYAYGAASDSVAGDLSLSGIDRIAGFDWTQDKLDINAGGAATNGLVLGIAGLNVTDVNTTVGSLDFVANNLVNDFNTNLAAQIDGILDPGQAAVLRVTGGSLAGSEVFVADINGNGSYDQGTDLVIIFDNTVTQLPPNTDFII